MAIDEDNTIVCKSVTGRAHANGETLDLQLAHAWRYKNKFGEEIGTLIF